MISLGASSLILVMFFKFIKETRIYLCKFSYNKKDCSLAISVTMLSMMGSISQGANTIALYKNLSLKKRCSAST